MMIRSGNENDSGKTLAFNAPTNVPVSAAIEAPNAKLNSLSQLTGIPITSAASGSSRSERHARPVRERFTKRSRTKTTTKNASAT